MTTRLLSNKYNAELHRVLNCYDRVIITGKMYSLRSQARQGNGQDLHQEPPRQAFARLLLGS